MRFTKKVTDYVLSWKYKGVYKEVYIQGYRMGIKLSKDPLVLEENSYLNKIVNIYIVYYLNSQPRSHTNNFKFKNCLFVANSIVKKKDKEKNVYSGYGADSQSFDNEPARNVIIFDVDNISSPYTDNCNNNFSGQG